MIQVYRGQQDGFPAPAFGSYEALGLDAEVCTDRYSRFGAYGYDEDSEDEMPGFTRPSPVLWWEVDWSRLQSLCLERNANRYKSIDTANPSSQSPLALGLPQAPNEPGETEPAGTSNVKQFYPRSAVLIRAWGGLDWTPNHREYLRSLIMELSLHSGGEYEIYLLIHVKDGEVPIYSNADTINRLRNHIPKEFRNMALFFNKKLLEAWYPKIKEHRYISPFTLSHCHNALLTDTRLAVLSCNITNLCKYSHSSIPTSTTIGSLNWIVVSQDIATTFWTVRSHSRDNNRVNISGSETPTSTHQESTAIGANSPKWCMKVSQASQTARSGAQ